MRKWVLLTVFLVATALVSFAMDLRKPPEPPGQTATRLFNEGKYAESLAIFNTLAAENKDNPQVLALLEQNIAACRSHLPASAAPLYAAVPVVLPTPTAAAPATAPATMPAPATDAPRVIDPTTGNARILHPKPKPGETLNLTIKELGNFPFDPVRDTTVPADVMALNGTKVTLRGFVIPFEEAQSITEFALQPSLSGCCFGQPAGVEHTIICHATPEKKIAFTPDEVLVTGKLIVKPQRENDYTHTLFELEVDSVAPAK